MLVFKLSIKKDIALSFIKKILKRKFMKLKKNLNCKNIDLIEIQKKFIHSVREDSNEPKDTLNFIIDTAILKIV